MKPVAWNMFNLQILKLRHYFDDNDIYDFHQILRIKDPIHEIVNNEVKFPLLEKLNRRS